MSGLNLHPGEENQPQHDVLGDLHEQARLRAEIEKQIEAEQAQARTQQQQERVTRQSASSVRENVQQRHAPQSQVRRRAFGFDAMMLCVVTLGCGAFIGPMLHPAPAMSTHIASNAVSPVGPVWKMPLGGKDVSGMDWANSSMEYSVVSGAPDGLQEVTGHFDWQANGQYAGTEEFSGTLDPTTHEMHVQGGDIQQGDMGGGARLVDGDYNLRLSPDNKSILSGDMQGIPGGESAYPGTLNGG